MALGRNKSKVALYGGNWGIIRDKTAGHSGSAGWVVLGELARKVEINLPISVVTIERNDGTEYDIAANRKCSFVLPLQQTGKDEIDLLSSRANLNKPYELYYYNGVVGGKHQVFYVPECKLFSDIGIKTSDTPKEIMVNVSAVPQESLASVDLATLPGTSYGLPAGLTAATGVVTGVNEFCVVLEN